MKTDDAGLPAETPVGAAVPGGTIQGILTVPQSCPRLGVVMASGGGFPQVGGRNQHWVRLADHLAVHGVTSYRFAYHGVGDSEGSVAVFDLAKPFTEDTKAAVRIVREAGAERVAVVGWCFGARSAVMLAPGTIDHLVLLSPPWRDSTMGDSGGSAVGAAPPRPAPPLTAARIRVLLSDRDLALRALRKAPRMVARRVRSRRAPSIDGAWYSTRMVDSLVAHLEAGVRLTIIYGTEDLDFEDFRRLAEGGESPRLRQALEQAECRVEILSVDGPVHDLATLDSQGAVVEVVSKSLLEVPDGAIR